MHFLEKMTERKFRHTDKRLLTILLRRKTTNLKNKKKKNYALHLSYLATAVGRNTQRQITKYIGHLNYVAVGNYSTGAGDI